MALIRVNKAGAGAASVKCISIYGTSNTGSIEIFDPDLNKAAQTGLGGTSASLSLGDISISASYSGGWNYTISSTVNQTLKYATAYGSEATTERQITPSAPVTLSGSERFICFVS